MNRVVMFAIVAAVMFVLGMLFAQSCVQAQG
jgi:hypothetical protein